MKFAGLALLLALLAACSSPSSPSNGCQVITGNTTTSFPASGGTANISIQTTNSCTWGAVSSASFVSITQGSSGAGNGTITFSVAANPGAQRTATITVTDTNTKFADTVITITQSGQ